MTQAYSDPARESDPYALPDVEIFKLPDYAPDMLSEEGEPLPAGWYWWSCAYPYYKIAVWNKLPRLHSRRRAGRPV